MSENPSISEVAAQMTEMVKKHWGRFLALGIILVIGGIIVIAMPVASSIAVALVIAFALILVGALQIWHAFSVKGWGGFLWELITGLIAVIGGIAIYYNPVFGTAALTLVMSAAFVAQGVSQAIFAFKLRPHDGWGWILLSGIVSMIAGLCIFFEFPMSAAWALGLVAGISIMFNGWSYIAIAIAARRMANHSHA
ncbi:HdeD family acid-resistance protein [Rhodobacteraceae bacterium RKSG542]|uniref:HdeD family acid-resistance protein n=1 Tax=Pseudovibrio flavus TaxID=2529854 RepID=UPI0012BD04F2|nr:HdeD family acid-resistance protein [Pseudovibrio flavus]MTI19295.1 HdeD family acid-resistance protein [Pseudovibrio flavus]